MMLSKTPIMIAKMSAYLSLPVVRERFWSKVTTGDAVACWPWTGATDEHGYGKVFLFGRKEKSSCRAHRVAFFYTHGSFPLVGRHSCDNQKCCNPGHILDGTQTDNVRDRDERGLLPVGEVHQAAKLRNADIPLIAIDTRSQRAIARSYGVSKSTIGAIKRGEAWRSVPRKEPHAC